MPKVSVIIPTYNLSNMLEDTVRSVLSQSFTDFEVIVIDDGSTDDTRAVIAGIRDSRVKYFYKQNGGVSAARNYGLSKATGVYIAFLDHDDLWPPNFLEVMASHLESKTDYGVVYCPLTVMRSDGTVIKSYKAESCRSGWITVDLFKKSMVWTSTAVIRASMLKGLFYDESLSGRYEDGDFYLRLSVRTPFLFVRQVEAIRREHGENLSERMGIVEGRILTSERFYFRLGGDKIIPLRIARRKLSHAYRSVAEARRREGCRAAAVFLYKRAIKYWLFDLRLYLGLGQSLLLCRANDPHPGWEMPTMLPEIPIGDEGRKF